MVILIRRVIKNTRTVSITVSNNKESDALVNFLTQSDNTESKDLPLTSE